MLGGANTGKSTFLVQLYGRMTTRIGRLVSRCAPADLKPISDGLQRLASGIPLEHTRTSADHLMQHLPAATHDGRSVDFNIPEYAGETLDDLVRSHRIPEYWRPLIAESDQWLLFVPLEQFGELPELLSRPIKEPEAVLSSRLLNKGVHVRNRRFKSLEPGSCWRKLCRSHGAFSPFGFADRPSWGTGHR